MCIENVSRSYFVANDGFNRSFHVLINYQNDKALRYLFASEIVENFKSVPEIFFSVIFFDLC